MKFKLIIALFCSIFTTFTMAELPGGCPNLKTDYLFVQNLIKDGNAKVEAFERCAKSGGNRLACAENTFGYSANKHNELLSEWLAKQDQIFNLWNPPNSGASCKLLGGGDLPAKVQGVYAKP